MDFGSDGSGDEIEDSSHEAATPSSIVFSGEVILREQPTESLPPVGCLLADPDAKLPVLRITIRAGTGVRVRASFWGAWCDRLRGRINRGDRIAVAGAEIDQTDGGPLGDSASIWMPPAGAQANAEVVITNERERCVVNARGIQSAPRAVTNTQGASGANGGGGEGGHGAQAPGTGGVGAAAGVGAAGGGGAPPGRAAGKRARGTEHSYTSLSALPLHRQQGGKPHYDLFGVVVEYRLPQATRGTDMRCSITVVDETCTSAADAHVATFFKAQPVPPGVGSVVRFHRIRPSGVYDGIRQLEATAQRGLCLTSWVYNNEESIGPPGVKSHTWTADDAARVGALAAWARSNLAQSDGPFVAARVSLRTLTEAVAVVAGRLPPGTVSEPMDLVARVNAVGTTASQLVAAPSRHGFAPSASAPQQPTPLLHLAHEPAAVPVWLRADLFSAVADALLTHMRDGGTSSAGVGGGAGDYAGGWVRLRNVNVVARSGGHGTAAVAVLVHKDSSVMRLPDYHADVAAATASLPQPAQADPRGAPPSCAPPHPAPAVPRPPAHGVTLLPPGQASPAIRLGAHGAVCTRPAADLLPESLHRHQAQQPSLNPAISGGGGGIRSGNGATTTATTTANTAMSSAVGGASCAPLTIVSLPPSVASPPPPLLTVKQALDHHAAAPCLLRVKARIRRAFPAEPLLWTARDDASSATARDAAWEYRMVLQLADTADDKAYLGAVVAGESASTFFAGLPPTDLSRSNASLFALRQRVTALCAESAPPTEVCLWACRPEAAAAPREAHSNHQEPSGVHGVAFHLVFTQCMVVPT